MKKSKIKPLLTVLLITATLFTACKSEEEGRDTPDLDSIEIRPEVVFTEVDDEPLNFYIESRGVVEPLQRTKITARINGYVESHQIEEGRLVDKGEVLLQFVDDEWKYELEQARNEYIKAKNEFEIESRLRNQSTNGNVMGDSLVKITTGLADAEVAYDRAKLNFSYTTIKAPFSGVISLREVVDNRSFISEGSYITSGQQLATLVDASKVRIRFDILESEIDNLETGMDVTLTGPGGNEFDGNIVAVSPEVDPATKTGQVLVEVDNPEGELKTGMTMEGRVFVRSEESKVRMPREALLERDGRTLVFKLKNKEVEWIYVTPVAMNTDYVLIDHPEINPGDTLAVDQHFSISHQQKVIPLMAE
jgi:RND family efflux transporter MFP subunit